MLPYFSEVFGNPASLTHQHGRDAANALEGARLSVARFFQVQPNELYFTAGATESNNLALQAVSSGDHLIVSAIEHRSVSLAAKRAESRGVELTALVPDAEGFVSAGDVRGAIRTNTRLVSIEAANGEIGTIQNIAEIAAICREAGVLYHSDVTQAAGKIPLPLGETGADLASFSGHKFYGPKGIGGLFARRGVRLAPLIVGGGQERKLRSGTVNVPGAVGMAAALEFRRAEMSDEAERLTRMRNDLWDRLTNEIDGAKVHGPRDRRLPGNLNVNFHRVDADSLIISMRRFSLSSGSACSSGNRGPSPVLLAIGAGEEEAMGAIRIGLGRSNTPEQIVMLVDGLKRSVLRLREISAA